MEAWSRILERMPGDEPSAQEHGPGPARGPRIRPRNVCPACLPADRLVLEGPADHYEFLGRYAAVDVALDTFPYNGGTTTAEALWQGVPVLTFQGDRWVSRTSASLLLEAGLPEFVAPDLESYVARAIELAWQPDAPARLSELRRGLRDHASVPRRSAMRPASPGTWRSFTWKCRAKATE